MRVSLATLGVLLVSASAYAQTPCTSAALTYDPYKPSDLAIVRQYGGTLLSQVPLSTLQKLDPYVPSQGELLRQVGNGLPVWLAHPWLSQVSVPAAVDCAPPPEPVSAAAETGGWAPAITRFSDVLSTLERQGAPAGTAMVTPIVAGGRPERNSGVWIYYADRSWGSAGAAVPFREADFVRIGVSSGFAVYRQGGGADDVIFVETARGMVAPFRATK